MEKKISFPMGNGMVKNGFYDPTTIPAKIQAKNKISRTRFSSKTSFNKIK